MGVCASSPEAQRSREVERALAQGNEDEASKIKLLLLGAGQCGKSTFFKQIKIIYGKPYSKEDRQNYTEIVHHNCITATKTLIVDGILGLGVSIDDDHQADIDNFTASVKQLESASKSDGASAFARVDHELGAVISRIWFSPPGKAAWDRRSEFQIDDSAIYWPTNIDKITAAAYLADEEDILRTRVRTTGIVVDKYIVNNVDFEIIDVGGQRNERKKWIHCFDNVTAIIFMCGISSYNQVLFEDKEKNRLMEALDLFDSIANSEYFSKTSIILFMNKFDLFEEKIKKVDLRNDERGWFQGYQGGKNCSAALKFISDSFMARVVKNKKIYSYPTVATDTENIKKVFEVCKDIILNANIENSGF